MGIFVIISTILISLAAAAIIAQLIWCFIKARKDIKLFDRKKSLFLLLSAPVIAIMNVVALIASDADLSFLSFFALIRDTTNVYAYELNKDIIGKTVEKYPFFYVALFLVIIMTVIVELFGAFVLFRAFIENRRNIKKKISGGSDIVIGYSADGEKYAKANDALLWAPNLEADKRKQLVKSGLTVLTKEISKENYAKLMGDSERHFFLFRDTDLNLFSQIMTFGEVRKECSSPSTLHVEARPEEMRLIKDRINSNSQNVCEAAFIYAFTKHDIIARNFVWEHPISRYIPRSFFNENCTIKKGADGNEKKINVVFIGFGKINRALFKLMSTQFQFVKQESDKLASHPVNYYVYEKEESHTYDENVYKAKGGFNRLFGECDAISKPEKICNLSDPKVMDVFSDKAFAEYTSYVSEDQFTYFIVSLADDFSDSSFALRLDALLASMPGYGDVKNNYKICVRTTNEDTTPATSEYKSIIYFGNNETYLRHESIANDKIDSFARFINDSYNDNNKTKEAIIKWNERPAIEIESNISNAISLRFKLNLLGLDIVDGSSTKSQVNTVEYCNYYFPHRGNYFGTESSNVLGYSEHSRWNALYIYEDYTQMKLSEITFKDRGDFDKDGRKIRKIVHKNFIEKKHACIRPYYALKDLVLDEVAAANAQPGTGTEYAEIRKGNGDISPEYYVSNIYSYDYMLLDKIFDKITNYGYKIVRL